MDRESTLRTLETAVTLTRDGQYLKAIERFESCLDDSSIDIPEAKIRTLRSYYGLCRALVWGETARPIQWCRAALEGGTAHPDLYLNLALVLLRDSKRDEAVTMLQKGQRLDPEHAGIQATFQRLTPRRKPLLGFLGRRHPLNRYLGMVRSRVLGA